MCSLFLSFRYSAWVVFNADGSLEIYIKKLINKRKSAPICEHNNYFRKKPSFVWLFCTSERSFENACMYDFVEKSMQSELWQVYKTIRSYQNMPKRPTLKPDRKRPSRNYPRPETYV